MKKWEGTALLDATNEYKYDANLTGIKQVTLPIMIIESICMVEGSWLIHPETNTCRISSDKSSVHGKPSAVAVNT